MHMWLDRKLWLILQANGATEMFASSFRARAPLHATGQIMARF
jgi:hypothetical protein